MKKDLFVCVVVAAVSLVVAAVFHRFFPGFGMVFKPLLWPLAVLPFAVRMRFAVATAFLVPLLSCAVNGMPTLPVALLLSAASAGVVLLLAHIPFRDVFPLATSN